MRRFTKTAGLALLALLAIFVVVAAAFFWRLSSGPVSLNFIRERIQAEINSNLGGMTVTLAGVVIERDAATGMPHFRLRNVELADAQGQIIARAPRAAIGVDGSRLLSGTVVPKQIELIGARILVRRTVGGGFELGFGEPAAADAGSTQRAVKATGKSDQTPALQPIAPETSGATLIDFLSGTMPGADGASATIANLDRILVSDAVIQLFDEINGSTWDVPKASLAFKRMPYGFTLFSEATIASGGEPWRAEISASYRRERKSFAVSARVTDLVPANISDEIFALSQLAQVKLPLSGHVELELSENADILKGSAEFTASAGELGFSGFIAEPLAVDEGLVRIDFDPKTGGMVITDSTLLVGGSQAELSGRVDPIREADERLKALRIEIHARNLNLDEDGTVKDAVAIDKVDFKGIASVREARLDVEDAVIMAGSAGLRLRGSFTGGGRSVGINLSGRIRDLPAAVLKKLWPPVIAPNTRKWVNANIVTGRITEGQFAIDLPVNALANGLKAKRIPNEAISARFDLDGVTTTYFGGLPPITGASGEGVLQGDTFNIKLDKGVVRVPSGQSIGLSNGSMQMTALLAPITPADIRLEGAGTIPAFVEYMNLNPLNLMSKAGLNTERLSGDANVALSLHLPLKTQLTRDAVKVSATAKIRNAGLKGALNGVDLADGVLDLGVSGGTFKAEGPVKLNGFPARISWTRDGGPDATQSATIETELDGKERDKIGAKIGEYVRGPVKVKVTLPELRDSLGKVKVEADLSEAELHLDAIDWWRPPAPKTSASFEYDPGDGKGGKISNLLIRGNGLLLKGDISMDSKGGIAEAKLPTVVLNEDNRFGLLVTQKGGSTNVSITGLSFDARPLIRSLFANRVKAAEASKGDSRVLTVDAVIDRVYAHRGEVITGVSGNFRMRGGYVERGNFNGTFVSGHPIAIRIEAAGDGGRALRIGGRDAGAALRAANLYSKVAGGQIEFAAQLGRSGDSSVRNGRLTLRDFEVRDEAALAQLDQKGRPKKTGPRNSGVAFSRLTLPFTSDNRFIRIGDTLVRGPELGATAQGLIRKADGAIDIDGTIIPAYAINSAIGEIPILGDILTGGKGEGVFGLTYALGGTMAEPNFQVNPVSAIAPGILRKFFEYSNSGQPVQRREQRK